MTTLIYDTQTQDQLLELIQVKTEMEEALAANETELETLKNKEYKENSFVPKSNNEEYCGPRYSIGRINKIRLERTVASIVSQNEVYRQQIPVYAKEINDLKRQAEMEQFKREHETWKQNNPNVEPLDLFALFSDPQNF